MGERAAVLERGKQERDKPLTDRDKVMTDVSDYAAKFGIRESVFISPQVLKDIKDVSLSRSGETDHWRLMGMMYYVREAREELPHNLKEETIPFSCLMALGRRNDDDRHAYDLVLRTLPNGKLEILCPSEIVEEKPSQEIIATVHELQKQLAPAPNVWWPTNI